MKQRMGEGEKIFVEKICSAVSGDEEYASLSGSSYPVFPEGGPNVFR